MVNNFISKGDGEVDRTFGQGNPDSPEVTCKTFSPGGVPGTGDHNMMCIIKILGQPCSQTTLRERNTWKRDKAVVWP